MDDINALIVRRGQIKAVLTRFQNYIRAHDCDVNQISHRYKKAEEAWESFDAVQSKLETLDISNDTDHSTYRADFENMYFETMTEAEQLMNAFKSTMETNTNAQGESSPRNSYRGESISSAASVIKLAALNIPVFNGHYADWTSFHDMFTALIHTNNSLTPIQKFFYLRSSLSNEPANCIKNLETTANNYEHAWKALISRYRNEKLLIQSHVKGICELSYVKENSSNSLRQFSDTLRGHMSALEALKQKPADWGPLLTHIICMKLDATTLGDWETKSPKNEISKVEDLISFLDARSQVLEAIESSKNIKTVDFISESKNDNRKKLVKNNNISTSLITASYIKCYVCNLFHTIYKCPTFSTLSVTERIKKVNELGLCKICLRKHEFKRCLSRRNCYKCHKAHNTLLHIIQQKHNEISNQPTASSSTNAHASNSDQENILLSTAIVRAIGNFTGPGTRLVLCRALLDSGSESNFITEEIVQTLQLKKTKTNHVVSGIGSVTQRSHSYVHARFGSRYNDYNLLLKMLVVPKITGDLPSKNLTDLCTPPDDINLADPLYYVPQKVDILIGATHFYELLDGQKIKPNLNGPVFQETKLGWVVSGLVASSRFKSKTTTISNAYHSTSIHTDSILENMLPLFWQMEECAHEAPFTAEEKMCEKYFNDTVSRGKDGRFIVHLPFRENMSKLGNSYYIAKRRFLSLERRFENNSELKNAYCKCINEYKDLGHLEQIVDGGYGDNSDTCYLPHHAVLKEASTSTRLRVVFDASCKTDNGISLNDILLKGPVLQDDLLFILTRFRTHNYVLSADITKMYRQFWVTKEHRRFQRILWREDSSEPIKIFQLNTITYGTVPASFLATGCLVKLAETIRNTRPDVYAAIVNDFYMDDFLGGAESREAVMQLRDGLIEVLSSAGLELRKWTSNKIDLISDLSKNSSYNKTMNMHEIDNSVTKILGLFWNSNTDALQYKVREVQDKNNYQTTKREMLAKIACLFDPLGLVGPAIVRAKLMLQRLWRLKVQWDEALPADIQNEWEVYKMSLTSFNELIVPRKIMGEGKIVNIQIHGFADASIEAYGCCLFLRTTNSDGVHTSKLICAKSKVAPLKVISLPRLELCAAVLLSRLASKVIPKIQLPVSKSFFWTDSKIVLAWISSQSSKWRTFVAHRVGEIQEKTSITDWYHVDTKDNPADIISRGCCPSKLSSSLLWWYGPEWLVKNEEEWPITNYEEILNNTVDAPEQKSSSSSALVTSDNDCVIFKYSSAQKVIRIIAYCMRFKTSCAKQKVVGSLLPDELARAKLVIIKLIQKKDFQHEIQKLQTSREVSPKSSLYRLRPFIDDDGIIRVGGRLKHAATISIFQRNPIVLPAKNIFTENLIREEHVRLMHGGPQAVLTSIRETYWPINGRNITRNVIRKCITCFKQRPDIVQPIMSDLPKDRVQPGRAFLKCGVDYAGPFLLKSSLRKNAPVIKAYVCLFVCFTTRAIHLELVGDLTTEAFVRALNRFFDRRGKSEIIYSDNATNFVGAQRHLKELYQLLQNDEHQKKTNEVLSKLGIEWKFIPARSPHFGGLWEAGIKSMKHLLRRVMGDAYFTYEELLTIITCAEACLNSRPLTPLSSDPSDFIPLTPSHFLIGNSLAAIPEVDETSIPINRLTRWRRVSQYSRQLWKRWSREYLSQLQERSKWAGEKGPKVKVGTVVLLKDDNLPSLRWHMGRVSKVITGEDGVIRVAEIRTAGGTVTRGVRKLCPLPFDDNRN